MAPPWYPVGANLIDPAGPTVTPITWTGSVPPSFAHDASGELFAACVDTAAPGAIYRVTGSGPTAVVTVPPAAFYNDASTAFFVDRVMFWLNSYIYPMRIAR